MRNMADIDAMKSEIGQKEQKEEDPNERTHAMRPHVSFHVPIVKAKPH